MKYIDLLYFGYDDLDGNSQNIELEFKKTIKEKFPEAKLSNAYDNIKGYRQQIYLPEEQSDDYFSWIIGDGWLNCSLTLQIMMRSEEEKSRFKKIWKLAKKRYPEAFKNG